MKKLYRKGTVHPSPPVISDHLAFLPAAILTLAAALSPADREVLAYLISCSSSGEFAGNRRNSCTQNPSSSGKAGDHPCSFNCNCFRCYMGYWVRWDSSPNRQLIHEIIDALEDQLAQNKKEKSKKERRKRNPKKADELNRPELGSVKTEYGDSESVDGTTGFEGDGFDGADDDDDGEDGYEKGSVRKIVSFIGERFWSVWT